jgi:phosphoglycerate dehydrogenase-like enzyme
LETADSQPLDGSPAAAKVSPRRASRWVSVPRRNIMEITGKTFAVTGGGNGIGRQVVLELLLRGAKVAALDIRD